MSHCSCSQTSLVFTISTCSCRTRSSGSALLAPFLPFRAVSRECAAWCVCFSPASLLHTHIHAEKNRDYSSVLTSLFAFLKPPLFLYTVHAMSVTCGSRPLPPLSTSHRAFNAEPRTRSPHSALPLLLNMCVPHTHSYTLFVCPRSPSPIKYCPLGLGRARSHRLRANSSPAAAQSRTLPLSSSPCARPSCCRTPTSPAAPSTISRIDGAAPPGKLAGSAA